MPFLDTRSQNQPGPIRLNQNKSLSRFSKHSVRFTPSGSQSFCVYLIVDENLSTRPWTCTHLSRISQSDGVSSPTVGVGILCSLSFMMQGLVR